MCESTFLSCFLVLTILAGGCQARPHTRALRQEEGISEPIPNKKPGPASDLCLAIARGEIARAKSMIWDGVDVNGRDEVGDTPLHRAAWHGRNEVAELLIAKGANVNAEGQQGSTPLHDALSGEFDWAASELVEAKFPDLDADENRYFKLAEKLARKRQIAMVKLLIAHGADVNAEDDFAETPLGAAVIAAPKYTFDPGIVRILIDNGADVEPAAAGLGFTTVEVAELLIANGADVNARGELGNAPLHWAASNGYKNLAKLLVNRGADIHVKNDYGRTPLHSAAAFGQTQMARFLLKRGADISAKDQYEHTPLYEAARGMYNKNETVEFLISKGAETNRTIAIILKTGSTPLHEAAEKGETQRIKALIARGDDINALDNRGFTPLHCSVKNGHKDAVELLVSRGANINAMDDMGITPLHAAVSEGHKNIVEFLISKDADVNAEDAFGFTPLSEGVYEGRIDIVELLIRSGADVNVKSASVCTLLSTARRRGHKEIVKLLLEHGAKE